MNSPSPKIDFRKLYDRFDAPVVPLDCGKKCTPHNPSGKPFCCDICHAVPSAYHPEWAYLLSNTDLWHPWRGDECAEHPEDPADLESETSEAMILLACLGPTHCQREYRAIGCREFPFFPYITKDRSFIGMTYNWGFEDTCWVISNLNEVTAEFQREFVQVYVELFSKWLHELDHYALRSEQMREYFIAQKRSISILHRDGSLYLLRPINERLRRIEPERMPKYGVYQTETE